jgi:diguanylate cyclase (GGDEF)-like protein
MVSAAKRRLYILGAAYGALMLLGFLAFETANIHVGVLAVVPILFISYYVRPPMALATAFVAGAALGLLDHTARALPQRILDAPPIADAVILSLSLCAIVVVANRLREMSVANELLRGSLVKARRAAEHDALTGIVNRTYFTQALDEAVHHATSARRVAVLFCDLDGFKTINDTYGHLIGDNVLRMAAARLVNTVRTVDTVARLGGDEFGVLVRLLHESDEAAGMARKIESAFNDPFHAENHRYAIGITVGIGICPDDAGDAESLLRIADERMYRAKENKRI